ncbi:MAG: MAPEG family protein [Pseudomonadota bacterium]
MTVISCLLAAVGLYFLNIVAQAVFANIHHDPKTLLGPRDGFESESVGLLRAKRAQANFTEAMVMFVPVALLAHVTGQGEGAAAFGGALFVVSRAFYLAIYLAGTPVVRSLAWAGGLLGTVIIFWVVLT